MSLWLVAAAFALPLAAAATSAAGQSMEAFVERFRAECRGEYAYLRGPGRHDVVVAHVKACIAARMDALARQRALETPSGGAPLRLIESPPWLAHNVGPASAKGVIYFIRGYVPFAPARDDFWLQPYFLEHLNAAGWDVIEAKVPSAEPDPGMARGLSQAARAEPFVRERLEALRGQGYRKIVLGGHSWGAWLSLLLAKETVADAAILSGPNAFGQRLNRVGRPNAAFEMILTQFAPAIDAVKIPTVVILPDDSVWDYNAGERGRIAEQRLTANHVPHLVIAKPPGFFGHFAGWLPFFDFAYGKCILNFLEAPSTRTCMPPPRRKDDFRSILALDEVVDADSKRIVSAQTLAGRKFVAYTLEDEDNKHFDYISATQRLALETTSENRETAAFRDRLQCVAGICRVLIGWSNREVLEFDPRSGALKAWWIEDSLGR